MSMLAQMAVAAVAITANGNAVAGGLSFAPDDVTAAVGDTVSWTNTDFIAPHTATEVNGLWELTGTDNGTPISPPGFGPGKTVERTFEAGTFSYFCLVHPNDMTGTVNVPVALAFKKTKTARRIIARWAPAALAEGQVYDVEYRRTSKGGWHPFVTGTTKTAGRRPAGKKGTVTEVRARLRFAADAAKASGWSPVASIRSK
jgi:plastocyanin